MGFREEMVNLRDDVLSGLTADGLVFAAENPTYMLTTVSSGADEDAGLPGVVTTTKTEIIPRPLVKLKEQTRRDIDGAFYKLCDATVKVSRVFELATLKAASGFEIDGTTYDLVDGQLSKTGLYWELRLKRREVA